jgi:hypothetical protein
VMGEMWARAYRDTPAQQAAFDAACKSMGWCDSDGRIRISLTTAQAASIGYDTGGKETAWVRGVRLSAERYKALLEYLFSKDGGDDPRGNQFPGSPGNGGVTTGEPGGEPWGTGWGTLHKWRGTPRRVLWKA